jgi:hypothetical protein
MENLLSPLLLWLVTMATASPLPRNLTFTSSPSVKCDFLLVAVHSRPSNFEYRDAIRQTWGNTAHDVIFILGDAATPEEDHAVAMETRRHGDILRVRLPEGLEHLAFKSVAMLQWIVYNCVGAKFIVKSDDDAFINIDALVDNLSLSTHSKFIMGDLIAGAKPMRPGDDSKWITDVSVYPDKTYPLYVSGAAYVISGDLIPDLYAATQVTPVFWIEDVYVTALCAQKTNATLISNPKFFNRRTLRYPCAWKNVLTVHKILPQELIEGWGELKNNEC